MRVINFISLVLLLTLTTFQISVSKAETATSGNLLPNAGDGVATNKQNSNSTIDNTGVNSGFTLNGITTFTNELEAQGTGTVSASGSLLNITTEKENGGQFNTTADSLDGGVRMDATTEVQNCEWIGSSSQCGTANNGRDTFSTTVNIKDIDGNVLATVTQNRNNDAGYRGNSYTYSDTITHTGTGARNWDWEWEGIDGNNSSATGAVGPNLLGAALTATLLDIDYQALSNTQQLEITEANERIETAIEEIEFEEISTAIEQIEVQEFNFVPPPLEIREVKIEQIEVQEFQVLFETNFKEIMVKENLVQEFESALIEENLTEQEFFQEATNMIMQELAPPPMKMEKVPELERETNVSSMTEPKMEKEIPIEKTPTEELKQTKKEELKEEGTNAITEKPRNEAIETKETMDTNEETTEPERQESEVVSNESELVEDKETEGQAKTESAGEIVENETDISVKDRKTTNADIDSIGKKVEKIIAKITAKLKRVDQQLAATSFIISKGISELAPDLTVYKNKKLNGGSMPDGNLELFQTLNILEQQQIYKDASLIAYISKDPIAVQQSALAEVETRINTLQAEISALKSLQ
jgi:hypothetical protein